jgi:anaerobic selenocysteine-containing dehydrogenase
MNATTEVRVVNGACPHDCPDTCALQVHVQAGQIIKVQGRADHPSTHGALCTKVARYAERTYHPERVLTPLKRVGPKGQGRFEPVTWDAALGDIAARLAAVAARDSQRIQPYSYAGTMGLLQGGSMADRLWNRPGRGTPRPHHLRRCGRHRAESDLRFARGHASRASLSKAG